MVDLVYQLAETYIVLTLVAVFCGSLFVRFAFSAHKLKQDYSYTPSVTVLMSCFNEGKAVFETINCILKSHYPKDKLFIIAIDDCSKDDSWEWMQKAAEGHPNVRVFKNEVNKGKPKSLLFALSKADSELILNVDSDGALHHRAIIELASCFVDEKVGAVGGNVMVRNSRANWLTQLQTLQYNTAFQLSKIGETYSGAVNCVSGALFMLRKQIYDEIVPDIENRRWAGYEVKDGEDRFMTNLILMRGYKAIINTRAKVLTDVPEEFAKFFSQQLRWRRGIVRLFLWSLNHKIISGMAKETTPLSVFKFYAVCLILIIWPIFVIWLLMTAGLQAFILLKLSLLFISIISAGIGYLIARSIGNDIVVGPFAFIIMPMWMVIDMFFLTILSICTLDSTSWETRNK